MLLPHAKAKIAALLTFGVLCLAIFVYLYQDAGGHLPFSSRYTVHALMPVTQNLVPNSDVDAAGVKVGAVDSVTPHGQDAEVTFSINKKTSSFPPLHMDATTQVRIKTLVGESYLEITPGTASSPKLPNGGTLPLSSAITSVPLEQILNMFDPQTRAAVRADMQGLGQGLNGHGTQLNRLFGTINPVVENGNAAFSVLDPEREQLASLINDTGEVMQALGQRTSDFQTLVVQAKATAVATASRAQQLKASLDTLPSTLAQARTTVTDLNHFSVRATPVFSNLRVASEQLSPVITELGPTAASARVLFSRLHPFLTAIQPLFAQLKPAASDLSTVIGPLDAVLRQGDPALSYLRPYANTFGSFFANVSALTHGPNPLGDLGRVDAVVAPNGSNLAVLNATERSFLDSLVKAGGGQGTELNSYPQPGSLGTPNTSSAYKHVNAAP